MNELNPSLEILERINRKTKRLVRIEEDIRLCFINGLVNDAYTLCLEQESISEAHTLLSRQLPCFTGRPRAKYEVLENIKQSIKVEIEFTKEGWFHLRMPALLPEKGKGSTAYIRDFLYPALDEFFSKNIREKYDKCHIIYRHVYDKNRSHRAYRDHDNYEINFVTDAVSLYTMIDDGPKHCAHHYYSAVGEKDETEVFVIPRKDLISWITKHDDKNL